MDEHALGELDAARVRLAEGDRSECLSVFTLLWTHLIGFAKRALGEGPDAEDAAQCALEKIFEQAADYDRSRLTLAWALAITGWECRTRLQRRKRRREDPLEGAAAVPSSTPNPEEAALLRSMLAALRASLAQLSAADQNALEEAFFRETDRALAPAFRKRKERALNRLRSAWSKVHGG